MGRRAGRGIVFLGLNPSYGPGDDPRLGWDFETYDHYWRGWFDAHAGTWPRLYQHYQEIGARAVDSFRIGEDALVLEMIRYRSARSRDLWELPGMFQRESGRTLALLREVAPRTILCCGGDALWCFAGAPPEPAGAAPAALSDRRGGRAGPPPRRRLG